MDSERIAQEYERGCHVEPLRTSERSTEVAESHLEALLPAVREPCEGREGAEDG